MNDRGLRTALIVSLLVNAFLAAAAAAGAIYLSNIIFERANMRQHTPLGMLAREVDPSVRDQLRQNMHEVALTAAPDFQEARAARRDAVEQMRAQTVDSAAVQADLVKARAAEDRGHAKVEDGFVAFAKTQPQAVRAKLAAVLFGRNSMRMNGPGRGGPPPHGDGVMPPPGSPPPPGQ